MGLQVLKAEHQPPTDVKYSSYSIPGKKYVSEGFPAIRCYTRRPESSGTQESLLCFNNDTGTLLYVNYRSCTAVLRYSPANTLVLLLDLPGMYVQYTMQINVFAEGRV